jgi:hypothetical protein
MLGSRVVGFDGALDVPRGTAGGDRGAATGAGLDPERELGADVGRIATARP